MENIRSDLIDYLEGNEFVENYTSFDGMYFIQYNDSSVIEYLNNNGFPVVYSSLGYILVNFSY